MEYENYMYLNKNNIQYEIINYKIIKSLKNNNQK